MKQLIYTSCKAVNSLSGASGFQVRAASPGLGTDRLRAALRYAGYALPTHVSPTAATLQRAPVRLALLRGADGQRVMCHSVYVGLDPTTGRAGNFLSHMLLDVPATLTAREAIDAWGSRFWQCEVLPV